MTQGNHNIILDIVKEVRDKNGNIQNEAKSVTVSTSTTPDDHSTFEDWCRKHQASVSVLKDFLVGAIAISRWRKGLKK